MPVNYELNFPFHFMQNATSKKKEILTNKKEQLMDCKLIDQTSRRGCRHTIQRWIQCLFMGFLALLAMFLCASCQTTHPHSQLNVSTERPRFVLAAGDVVTISFTGTDELNQVQKIRLDGKLNLPLVGEINAAGKTIAVLQQELTQLYKPHLRSTTVLVGLQTTVSVVYVSGAVNGQGKIILDRPMTALEAIMEAGGFVQGLANSKRVILVREENGKHQTRTLDLSPKALNSQTTGVTYLKPFDMLIVPERMF